MKALNSLISKLQQFTTPLYGLWAKVSDDIKKYIIVFLCVGVFISLGYSYMDYEYYFYAIIPVVLLTLLLFYYKMDKILFLIAFITPFSINQLIGETVAISFPSEPLLILFAFLFVVKTLIDADYPLAILKHPIAVAIYIYLGWMFITSLTSTDMLVSMKYFASKICYVVPFFFAIALLFKDIRKIKMFYFLYATALAIVVLITTIKFALRGFEFQYSFYIMQPFYNDHTAYGAVTALLLLPSFLFMVSRNETKWIRIYSFFLFVIILLGLMLSYSRAAWLSILPSLFIYVVLKLRIKLKLILTVIISAVLLFFTFQTPILQLLAKNNQDSSGNIMEHIASISNISTDASNVERLNRWACAFRMFEEEPIFGWGPGTYQFEYGAYQKSRQLSTISTNTGKLGNAHSEYFGALSDSGVFGMASVLILFIATMSIGIKIYKRAEDKEIRMLALFLTMSLVTYYSHSVMNNFLDTDKLSVPFWGFAAAIASLDVYSIKRERLKSGDKKL